MEKWHDNKINKYLPLMSAMKSRGWEVDLYATEVGGSDFVPDFCCVVFGTYKKNLEDCEQAVNGIFFLYLAGCQRQCSLAIC